MGEGVRGPHRCALARAGGVLTRRAPRFGAQENRLHRDTPFLCDFRFRTPLPPPPIGPKLLPLVVDRSRFTAYRPFNLWWDRPSELPWEMEVGQALDPMDVEQHRVPPGPPRPLHPADEALLAPLTSGPPVGSGPGFRPGKSKPTAKAGWLMRTLYLSDSQLPKVSDTVAEQLCSRAYVAPCDLLRCAALRCDFGCAVQLRHCATHAPEEGGACRVVLRRAC